MAETPYRSRDLSATACGFHTTHWTIVLAASQPNGDSNRDALASLCSTYWYPLYAFIRRRGVAPHEAEDLTQEFFHRFLKRDSLAYVRPDAGKFRSFLLACLKNFLANEWERSRAERRGGGRPLIPLDGLDAQTRYALEPADQRSPDALFERRWAFAVLEQSLAELRREYTGAEKGELYEAIRGFLPGGETTGPRSELAKKLGMSPGALDVAIHRLRQRFGVLLRQQVARTVSADAEVNEEFRYLISVICS